MSPGTTRDRMKTWLRAVCADPALEARWLHTLSLLEFMGARKIGRSVAAHHPSPDVLEHWADETRHAAVLARLAKKGTPEIDDVAALSVDATKRYFQAVDHEISSALTQERASPSQTGATRRGENGHPHLNYLIVTAVIERRAMMVYPLYRATTARQDVREALTTLIAEEQSHRTSIEAAAERALAAEGLGTLEVYEALEGALFEPWLTALEANRPAVAVTASP